MACQVPVPARHIGCGTWTTVLTLTRSWGYGACLSGWRRRRALSSGRGGWDGPARRGRGRRAARSRPRWRRRSSGGPTPSGPIAGAGEADGALAVGDASDGGAGGGRTGRSHSGSSRRRGPVLGALTLDVGGDDHAPVEDLDQAAVAHDLHGLSGKGGSRPMAEAPQADRPPLVDPTAHARRTGGPEEAAGARGPPRPRRARRPAGTARRAAPCPPTDGAARSCSRRPRRAGRPGRRPWWRKSSRWAAPTRPAACGGNAPPSKQPAWTVFV